MRRAQRQGCGVWSWSPQVPGRGARAGLGPPQTNRAVRPEQTQAKQEPPGDICGAGVSWDQLPRKGQERVWTRAWRAVSAPGGAGGLQGEGAAPSDGGGTQGLTASVLHVHSFPEPSPGVEPSVAAQQP